VTRVLFRPRRAALAVACAVVASVLAPAGAQAAEAPVPVSRLTAALADATREAERAADAVLESVARAIDARRQIGAAAERYADAREALGDRLRDIYINGPRDPVTAMLLGRDGHRLSVLANVQRAGVRSDEQLIREVRAEATAMEQLRQQVAAGRGETLARARRVYALQDKARRLLAQAEAAFAADKVVLAEITVHRLVLDTQSREVSVAVQPIQPTVDVRGRRAGAAEAPVIAALEAAGSAFPAGYGATGRVFTGEASWYGPGFVGRPTATGAPYDPERFTAAMLLVPLGTVVRVSTAEGRAVNVLVNDRGPYAGGSGRILDMSAAGARMLGYSGVQQVRIEVLERVH
jgi:rare lipoprotein A (peptidoglycan hydrolase)